MGPTKHTWICLHCRISTGDAAKRPKCPGCGVRMVKVTPTTNSEDRMTDTTKSPDAPLTAAQVELVQQLIEDRQERLVAKVDAMIGAHIDALIDSRIAPLEEAAIKYGERIALRAASGKLVGANHGGPTDEGEPFEFVAKTNVAAHESFTTERGQG